MKKIIEFNTAEELNTWLDGQKIREKNGDSYFKIKYVDVIHSAAARYYVECHEKIGKPKRLFKHEYIGKKFTYTNIKDLVAGVKELIGDYKHRSLKKKLANIDTVMVVIDNDDAMKSSERESKEAYVMANIEQLLRELSLIGIGCQKNGDEYVLEFNYW